VVIRNSQVTKHFYIESQRVVTKLTEANEGLLQEGSLSEVETSGVEGASGSLSGVETNAVNYKEKKQKLKNSITKNYNDLGLELTKVDGEAGNSGQTPPNGNAYGQQGNGNNGNDGSNGNAGGTNGGGDGNNGNGSNTGSGGNGNDIENMIFYYHLDHLGSSSYITDVNGEVTQHVEYFAFGETFLEEHSNTDRTPYLFNGKELDEETGLYYYGARYYDAKTSVWQSVDPLAGTMPSWSPYNFVFNNPLRFVDPLGLAPDDWVKRKDGSIYWDKNANDQASTKAGETYLGKNVLVGTHNRDATGNEAVNTAQFDLYLESDKTGPTATIMGNTVPSDITKSGTLAEGLYSAKFGHRNRKKYHNELAIRIYNLDGSDGLPTVNGNPSKANSDLLTGVLFHMGNNYQTSLFDSRGNAYSHGCQTSGCFPNSRPVHNAFMNKVGRNFKGTYYLRSKPSPVIPSIVPFSSDIPGLKQ